MKYTTDNKKITEVLDEIDFLSKLFNDRISDMHEVKGTMQARHAYILYRKLLWEIKESLLNALTEVPEKPKKP
jgi:hypothetical protein